MKIKYLIEKALNTKFTTRAKGYDPREVDELLDELINQIRNMDSSINTLDQRIKEANEENSELKIQLNQLNERNQNYALQVEELLKSGFQNEALAHRVMNLEKEMNNKKDK